jgi:hypothetical protein
MTTEVATQQLGGQQIVLTDEVKQLLAKAAEDQGAAEISSIPYMSIKGKKFSIGDEKLGTTLDVVILADMYDHSYYDRDYDPDTITPPACFAINSVLSEMTPHETSPDKQSASCNTCPKNEFGSAKNGKGKACRNGRRLLVAAVTKLDHDQYQPNLGDLAIINIPPTSLKAYARYTKNITVVHKLPTWAVVTKLTFDDDSAWPSIVPLYITTADPDTISKISKSLTEYTAAVSGPYDTSNYVPLDQADASTVKRSKMS